MEKQKLMIVLAVYNGEQYLERQLRSIEEQTVSGWYLMIRDDNSTDRSGEIIKEFCNRHVGRVSYFRNEPGTGSAKKNFAMLLQDAVREKADYVMCCDQDDVWKKHKIEWTLKKMKHLEEKYGKNKPLLVHGDLEVVDENGRQIAPSMFQLSNISPNTTLPQLLVQNNVTGCTMMMNRPLTAAVAKAAGQPWVIMHDYLAALYATVFGKVGVIQAPLLSYRQHGDNSVGAKSSHSFWYLWQRLQDGKQDYRQQMEQSYAQIAGFSTFYNEELLKKPSCKKIIEDYGSLSREKKGRRLAFYRKHRAWKKGCVRKIMQILWG